MGFGFSHYAVEEGSEETWGVVDDDLTDPDFDTAEVSTFMLYGSILCSTF